MDFRRAFHRSELKMSRTPAKMSPAVKVKEKTMESGGATTDVVGEDVPVKRYIYNPGPTVTTMSETSSRPRFARAIRRTHQKGHAVGTWRSEGKVAFDPSTSTDDLPAAKTEARKHRQHAIYDTHKGKDVVICGKGGYKCAMHGG